MRWEFAATVKATLARISKITNYSWQMKSHTDGAKIKRLIMKLSLKVGYNERNLKKADFLSHAFVFLIWA